MPPQLTVPNGYRLERLDTARHSRASFTCGYPDLDEFLRTQAGQAQGKYTSATHVLIESIEPVVGEIRPIVGYVTLVSSQIPLSNVPLEIKKPSDKPLLPALLLAKMGVDNDHRGRDLGECLLRHALISAWEMNQRSGCLLILVHAKDETSKGFYIKYGFIAMHDKPLTLFLPMKTIEKIFSN